MAPGHTGGESWAVAEWRAPVLLWTQHHSQGQKAEDNRQERNRRELLEQG